MLPEFFRAFCKCAVLTFNVVIVLCNVQGMCVECGGN